MKTPKKPVQKRVRKYEQTKRSEKATPSKYISPVGWYVATYIERFEFEDEDISNENRRCRAWENVILVKAKTPREAYKRAMYHARKPEMVWTNHKGQTGKLLFEGLVSLLAIYDEIEDGAEIIWTEFQNISVRKVKRRVSPKEELEVFQK